LRDTKVKPEVDLWTGNDTVESAVLMGAVLARAHARSGDAAVIAGYLGDNDSFDQAISEFAIAYANQTEKDHFALLKAVNSGRIIAADDAFEK
jgi:NAD(P)H-dependent flavin oxidoreductase YrpB (nitropropane dioxygenase family)